MRALDCTTATLASRSRSRSCCSRASRSRSHSIATEHAYPCRAHAPYVSACNHLRSIALAAQASSPTQANRTAFNVPKFCTYPTPRPPLNGTLQPQYDQYTHLHSLSSCNPLSLSRSIAGLMDCRAMVAHSLICISPRSLTQQQPPSLAPSLA